MAGLAAAPRVPPRAVLTVHARGTHGREEEEDVAREGEMAAENKPEGKRDIMALIQLYDNYVICKILKSDYDDIHVKTSRAFERITLQYFLRNSSHLNVVLVETTLPSQLILASFLAQLCPSSQPT